MYHRIKPVGGWNEQWLCNPFAGIICAVWMKVVKAFDWPAGAQGPRVSDLAKLSRRNKDTLWRGEELCEIRLMPVRPQLPPEIQAGSRLGRLTVEQRERVKALRISARKRNRETGALEEEDAAETQPELYNRQGEDLRFAPVHVLQVLFVLHGTQGSEARCLRA
jgi:hypothetical protein